MFYIAVAPALPSLLTRARRTEPRAHLTTHAKNTGQRVSFNLRRNDRTHVLDADVLDRENNKKGRRLLHGRIIFARVEPRDGLWF